MNKNAFSFSRSRGFSLLELALVMLIMGSLLSGLLVALTQTSENTRRTAAKNQLGRIEEALYSFAQANGRLPCPASATSDGYESPDDGTGICDTFHGFVPAATLALYGRSNVDGLMLDPWANPYRYSVAQYPVVNGAFNTTGSSGFTIRNNLDEIFSSNPAVPINDDDDSSAPNISDDFLLKVCDIYNCTGIEYTVNAPAVVLSMGKNWNEAATNQDCGTVVNTNEVENAGAQILNSPNGNYCATNTNRFVDAEYNEETFDDIVTWLSPYVLFSRMISAGQLP